jgi:broad specificity phosphatase PhoE
MKIYLTRHGETVWNVRNWVQGKTDIPLNEIGMKQAEQLAEEMANVHLDVVYSSQLQRAMVTAQMVAERHGNCRFEVNESLNEMNFGKFEAKSRTNQEYQGVRERITNISR